MKWTLIRKFFFRKILWGNKINQFPSIFSHTHFFPPKRENTERVKEKNTKHGRPVHHTHRAKPRAHGCENPRLRPRRRLSTPNARSHKRFPHSPQPYSCKLFTHSSISTSTSTTQRRRRRCVHTTIPGRLRTGHRHNAHAQRHVQVHTRTR